MTPDSPVIWIFLGLFVGTLGTLIGAGGGFILVPILLLTRPDLPPATVTAISMAIVAANAVSGSVAYARSGRIDFRAGILFALCTIPGSVAGVMTTAYIPKTLFHLLFGCLLLALGIFLFYTSGKEPKKQATLQGTKWPVHRVTDKEGNVFEYPFRRNLGIFISVIVGYLSPILGIGGGIIHVPALVNWLGFPVYIATATSHFILAVMSSVSVVTNYFAGTYNDPVVWHMVLWLAIGAVVGAQGGAWLSHRLKGNIIIRALAVSLGLVGLRILLSGGH